jgi:hypothetical protein
VAARPTTSAAGTAHRTDAVVGRGRSRRGRPASFTGRIVRNFRQPNITPSGPTGGCRKTTPRPLSTRTAAAHTVHREVVQPRHHEDVAVVCGRYAHRVEQIALGQVAVRNDQDVHGAVITDNL